MNDRHVIISPHFDDAELSMGGHLLHWQAISERASVVTVFSMASWTNPDGLRPPAPMSVPDLIGLRRGEALAASSVAGHDLECLDHWDVAERGGRRTRIRQTISARRWSRTGDRLVMSITRQLDARMHDASDVFFPLACGLDPHPDHLMLREIGLRLHSEGHPVRFYEDLPYAARVVEAGTRPTVVPRGFGPELMNIDLPRKLDLVGRFGSQVSQAWLDEVASYAHRIGGGVPAERVWV